MPALCPGPMNLALKGPALGEAPIEARGSTPDARLGGMGAVLIVALLVANGAIAFSVPSAARASDVPAPSSWVPPALRLGPMNHPAASGLGAQGRLLLQPTDPAVVPNDGIQTNITGFDELLIPSGASFQVGAEEVIGAYDAVFGIFANSVFGTRVFLDVFTNSSDQSVHLAYGSGTEVYPGTGYELDLTRTNGTVWTLRVNGLPLGGSAAAASFDFGARAATWAGGVGFSEIALYGTSTSVPTVVNTTLAFAIRGPSGWYLPDGATSSFSGQGALPWGIEGRDQVPTLAPGEIRTGTSIAPLANGTRIWTGGPVPVRISLALAGTSTVGTLPINGTAAVTDFAGRPVPGVPLGVTDSFGGALFAGPIRTGLNGSTSFVFVTPNVSHPAQDLVSVSSSIFGYVGEAGLALALSPPTQVRVSAGSPVATVAPSRSIDIRFVVTSPSGSPVSSALLVFSSSSGGWVSVPYGRTGADGAITVTFSAGVLATTSVVSAQVSQPGIWGRGDVSIQIAPITPTIWERIEPTALVAGPLAGGAAVLVAALLVRRARRRPLPDLPLDPLAPERSDEPRSAEGQEPFSRTPPSGGTP